MRRPLGARGVLYCLACLTHLLILTPGTTAQDCNNNGVPDAEDIAAGISGDCDGNGVPDDCDVNGVWNLAPGDSVDVGAAPYALATGDFDGNGTLDLAVPNSGSDTISVLSNDGAGGFTSMATLATAALPRGLVAADLDADGDIDLSVALEEAAAVAIFTNQGDGTFASTVQLDTPELPIALGLGDLDADGRVDIVGVSSRVAAANMWILWNEGDGTYSTPQTTVLSGHPQTVAVADFTGDGLPDLAAVMHGTKDVAVMVNGGDRVIGVAVTYDFDHPVSSIAPTDLNGDGHLDLVSPQLRMPYLEYRLNDGTGVFGDLQIVEVSGGLHFATAGDMDNDGLPEIVTVHRDEQSVDSSLRRVAISRYFGAGDIREVAAYRPDNQPFAVAPGEFTGDAAADVAVVFANEGQVQILVSMLPTPTSLDINGDGVPDECRGPTAACPAAALTFTSLAIVGLSWTYAPRGRRARSRA